jgi:hypothetical protein
VPLLWRMAMSRPTELALRAWLRRVPNGAAQYGLAWFYTHIAAARPGRLDPLVREGFLTPYALGDRLPALFPLARVLLDELRTGGSVSQEARSSSLAADTARRSTGPVSWCPPSCPSFRNTDGITVTVALRRSQKGC